MKHNITWLTLLCSLLCCANSMAYDNATQVERYITVSNKPSPAQINLLSQLIQIRFPQSIQTIGEAMNYLLKPSGYSLAPSKARSDPLKTTLSKPLPFVDRSLGPVSIKDGLTTLAGPAFTLTEDPINRTVNFSLKKSYRD